MTDDPERAASAEDDDLADEDLQLKQLRSVWLSMRDDDAEPSDRGMAALMAAAREKAAEMAPRPSWWAKLLDQLRRPPVLALATVVVLVGGAVVIAQKQQRGELEDLPSDQLATDTPTKNVAPERPAGSTAATAPPPAAAPTDPAPMEAPAGATASPPPPKHRPRRTEPTTEPTTEPAAAQTTAPTVGGAAFDGVADAESAAGRVKETAEKKVDAGGTRGVHGGEARQEASPPPAPSTGAPMQLAAGDEADTAAQPKADRPVSRSPLPAIEGEDRAVDKDVVARLVKQCQVAAANNDCATARLLAQRIAKQDPTTYRDKILTNASVTRCLQPPPAQ